MGLQTPFPLIPVFEKKDVSYNRIQIVQIFACETRRPKEEANALKQSQDEIFRSEPINYSVSEGLPALKNHLCFVSMNR